MICWDVSGAAQCIFLTTATPPAAAKKHNSRGEFIMRRRRNRLKTKEKPNALGKWIAQTDNFLKWNASICVLSKCI